MQIIRQLKICLSQCDKKGHADPQDTSRRHILGGSDRPWRTGRLVEVRNTTFSADAAQYKWDMSPKDRNGGSNRSRLCLTMHPARYDDKEVLEKYDCSIKKYGLCEKKGLR